MDYVENEYGKLGAIKRESGVLHMIICILPPRMHYILYQIPQGALGSAKFVASFLAAELLDVP